MRAHALGPARRRPEVWALPPDTRAGTYDTDVRRDECDDYNWVAVCHGSAISPNESGFLGWMHALFPSFAGALTCMERMETRSPGAAIPHLHGMKSPGPEH
jgi:hypothetical protein